MGKYIQVITTNFQISLSYKWNLLLSALTDIFRIIAEIAFWKVIFNSSSQSSISGYNFNSIISYYILMFIIGNIMNVSAIGYKVANDIKDGTLTNLIVRPINYLIYYFSETLSQKLVQLSIIMVVFIPVLIVQSPELNTNLIQLLFLPILLLLSFILNYLINILISLLVFWFTEVTSFFMLKDIIFDFLSGRFLPIDILPKSITTIFNILPFMYCTFFPITVLTKVINNETFSKGLIVQIMWIIILFLGIKIIWHQGIKRYSGTGM